MTESSPRIPRTTNGVAVRALISTRDAGLVIGRGGKSVQEIRDQTQCRVHVGDLIPEARDRVLNVFGDEKSVAKAFAMIVGRLLGGAVHAEGSDEGKLSSSAMVGGLHSEGSATDSALQGQAFVGNGGLSNLPGKVASIRLLIPDHRMGSIIGKQGLVIRSIQDYSKARLLASDQLMSNSTDRQVVVRGTVEQVEKAMERVAGILMEFQGDRSADHIPYLPSNGGHQPNVHERRSSRHGQGLPQLDPASPNDGDIGVASRNGASGQLPPRSEEPLQSQQIHIPVETAGAIIGHGGSRIREIRANTGASIKIADQEHDSKERLVTVTGSPEAIQSALYMICSRLESEKRRLGDPAEQDVAAGDQ